MCGLGRWSVGKPWDETWSAHAGDECEAAIVVTHDASDTIVVEDQRTAALIAAAPDLVRALLAVEWIGPEAHRQCSSCGASDVRGHYDECALAAALRKAGVIE